MRAAHIKKKLHHYIDTTREKKLKAIYVMLEDEIEATSIWEDAGFIAKLDKNKKVLRTVLPRLLQFRRQNIKRRMLLKAKSKSEI